ncbi:rpl7ae [Nucleospora cyclopteri]
MTDKILSAKKSQELFKILTELKSNKNVKVGINETIKAISNRTALLVVFASDASPKCLVEPVSMMCENFGINYVYVESKRELGEACKLKTHAIAAAVFEKKEVDGGRIAAKVSQIY